MPCYSAYSPAAWMMGFHFTISDWSCWFKAAGVACSWDTGSVPRSAKRSTTFGSLSAAWRAVVSLSTTGCGVPLGA